MTEYVHPRALDGDAPAIAVDIGGGHVALDDDGHFETADDAAVARLADAYGVDVSELRVAKATCDVVKTDGEVCGRQLPCPYHSED